MIIVRAVAISMLLAVCSMVTPRGLCQDAPQALPMHQDIIISQELQNQITERYEEKAKNFSIFLQSIKNAIEQNEIKTIVTSVQYPIRVDVNGRQKTIKSPNQLSQLFSTIFTDDYKHRVLEDFSDLHVLSQGVMLGRGSMWINLDQKNVNWKIITINN